IHRGAEHRIAEVDRQLGGDVVAAHRRRFESGRAAAEKIREDVGKSSRPAARPRASAAAARAGARPARELREIEAGERILTATAATERECLRAETIVLGALLRIAQHR